MPAGKAYLSRMCITSVTPTVCNLMGIPPPALSTGDVLGRVVETARGEGVAKVDKCLIYAPDAIGSRICRDYETRFKEVMRHAPIRVPLRSVFPPKTPVCFASMFTGAMPKRHGIIKYDKRVLACDTIFDAFARERKATAIVAVRDSSIDRIFRDRVIDYFSEAYDRQVTDRTLDLIKAGEHDLVVAYHQQYDDVLHETGPRSGEALEALENHIAGFLDMAQAVESYWAAHNRMIAFAPDHGAHMDPATGRGTHGDDIAEDMEVDHFYGIAPA
ncbi:MAG: alkaline phosphatase family protein [Candidatus Eisenbacteria bacterium]